MKKAEEYREHAAECRQLATKAVTVDERDQLLAMAETWEMLAIQRTEFLSKHPELARQASEAAEQRLGNIIQPPAGPALRPTATAGQKN